MQVMLMRLMSKGEYLIVPKGTKFTGAGKLGLSSSVGKHLPCMRSLAALDTEFHSSPSSEKSPSLMRFMISLALLFLLPLLVWNGTFPDNMVNCKKHIVTMVINKKKIC